MFLGLINSFYLSILFFTLMSDFHCRDLVFMNNVAIVLALIGDRRIIRVFALMLLGLYFTV